MAGPADNAQLFAANQAVRQDILAKSIPVLQNVRSGSMTYAAGSPTVVNVLASNVGAIRRFYLVLSGTIDCASGHTATAKGFGIANLLSNVQFTDQNNRLRINTDGKHLHNIATEKRRRSFGGALVASTGISDVTGMGANFPVQSEPSSVSGGTSKTFTFIWEIPVVNSNQDLSGLVYANQTTSNNQIQFTINPNFFVYSADCYDAGYSMDAALATSLPTLTNLTWTLYQDFLDQLPTGQNGYVTLPPLDISFALCLQKVNPGGQVAGVDNLYALPPFNIYQNIMLFWDNYTYNTVAAGNDVTYIKVQISNTYVLRQWDPLMLAVLTRNTIGTDFQGAIAATLFSGGVYSLDFRHKPLSVQQLSSTNIVFRPATVQSGAALNLGLEYLWYANANAGG